jgi:hypothetical protein
MISVVVFPFSGVRHKNSIDVSMTLRLYFPALIRPGVIGLEVSVNHGRRWVQYAVPVPLTGM